MSYQNQSFGIMDEGYFVPRSQILNWLNELLKLNLTKIEQLGSGSVYCQVVDVIHPGSVSMAKVNWKAKNDYEFISNLKILQNAFSKVGIKRYVEVEKLSKAKYQDNLQFIQWLKRYYDKNCGDRGSKYDAEERRGNATIDLAFAEKNVVTKVYNGSGVVVPPSKSVIQQNKPKKQTVKETLNINRVKTQSISNNKKNGRIIGKDLINKPKLAENKEEQLLLKQLQFKLNTITEIIGQQQAAEVKIKMIQNILSSSTQQKQQLQQPQQLKKQILDILVDQNEQEDQMI